MKFERVLINKKAFVRIKPESDINIDKKLVDISKRLIFNIEAYDKLSRDTNDSFSIIIQNSVNRFINKLTQDEKSLLLTMFCEIKYSLENHLSIEFQDMIENIMELIDETFDQGDFVEKMREYVSNNKDMAFPDFSIKYSYPKSLSEEAFTMNDYIDLIVLSIICKLLFPVFGDIIAYAKNNLPDNEIFKEQFCMNALSYIFENDFYYLIMKIKSYISNEVTKKKESLNLTDELSKRFIVNDINRYIFAILFIKKFVNIDLYRKNCNMLVYIVSCVKYTLSI